MLIEWSNIAQNPTENYLDMAKNMIADLGATIGLDCRPANNSQSTEHLIH